MALTEYQAFVKKFFAANPGTDVAAAAKAWQKAKGGGGGGGKRKRNPADSCKSDLVPTADGTSVTKRGEGQLRASVEGHTEVQFDQGALGAIWSGIIERLRSDGGANLAALFPDLYPDAALAMRMDRQHADNRAIGYQMAPLIGAVIVAYRITPEEWASWYAVAVQQRFVVPQQRGICLTVTANTGGIPVQGGQLVGGGNLPPEALNQAGQFGGIMGAPGGAVHQHAAPNGGQFGALR